MIQNAPNHLSLLVHLLHLMLEVVLGLPPSLHLVEPPAGNTSGGRHPSQTLLHKRKKGQYKKKEKDTVEVAGWICP